MSQQVMFAAVSQRSREERHAAPARDATRESGFATDIEHWLRQQPSAENAVRWAPRGAMPGEPVASADRLADLVGGLRATGAWAVVRRPNAERWVQCMRAHGGWIVEVNGIPGPDCYARRVQGGRPRWRDRLRGRKMIRSRGRLMAVYVPEDVFASPGVAADVMWAWLRGGLPEGFELREL